MVPGQIALLLGGIVCAVVLLIMGYISFSNAKKERRATARKKAREESERQLQQAREEAAFDQKLDEVLFAEDEAFVEKEEPLFAEDTPIFVDPVESKPFVLEEDDFFAPEPKPTAAQRPRTTRNDFDFKF